MICRITYFWDHGKKKTVCKVNKHASKYKTKTYIPYVLFELYNDVPSKKSKTVIQAVI